MLSTCQTFYKVARHFLIMAVPLDTPASNVWGSSTVNLLKFSHSSGCVAISYDLDLHFPNDYWWSCLHSLVVSRWSGQWLCPHILHLLGFHMLCWWSCTGVGKSILQVVLTSPWLSIFAGLSRVAKDRVESLSQTFYGFLISRISLLSFWLVAPNQQIANSL